MFNTTNKQSLLFESEPQMTTIPFPLPTFNPQKPDNYFIQIKKAIKKQYTTKTSQGGLAILGNTDEILTYLDAAYAVYNCWAKDNNEPELGYNYFRNCPGITYWAEQSETKELKRGDDLPGSVIAKKERAALSRYFNSQATMSC